MSNKTQLQANNTTLDGYIARINAAKEVAASLPEAGGGGGGSVETCTVTLIEGSPMLDLPTIHYTDSNMTLQTVTTSMGVLTVPVGTIIIIVGCTSMDSIEGDGEQIFYTMGHAAYKINGTCRITLEG